MVDGYYLYSDKYIVVNDAKDLPKPKRGNWPVKRKLFS